MDGGTFRHVRATLSADAEMVDRVYPMAVRVGEGWQVHGPCLHPACGGVAVRVSLPEGWTALPSRSLAGDVYLGPRTYLRDGVVAAPEVPDRVRTQVVDALVRARSASRTSSRTTRCRPGRVGLFRT